MPTLAEFDAATAGLPEPVFDEDSPELMEHDFLRAIPPELWPESLFRTFPNTERPPKHSDEARQRAVTVQLDPEVLEGFQAIGPGWEKWINAALQGVVRAGWLDLIKASAIAK